MTEIEWNLRKDNAQLRMWLVEARSQLLVSEHDKAKAEFAALGDKWMPPEE